APAIEEMKNQREQAISQAKTNLGTYDEMTKSLKVELAKSRDLNLALSRSDLKDYEKMLPAQAALWETRNNPAETKTTWVLVEPKKVSATAKVRLSKRDDGSIASSGAK